MCRWRWSTSRGEYVDVYRVGPPPPLGLYGTPRRPISRTCRRRGGVAAALVRILPAVAVGSPPMAALAPAPRRALPPDAPGRRDGLGPRGGNPSRVAPAPASLAPNTVTPPPGAMPSPNNNRPPDNKRPPGWGPSAGRRSAQQRCRCAECVRAKSCCSTCSRQRDAIAGRSAACGRSSVRPVAACRAGDCQPDATGGAPALGTAAPKAATPNAVGPAPRQQPPVGASVRPVVVRLPASPTARRRPARRRNPPRSQRASRATGAGEPATAADEPAASAAGTARAGQQAAATAGARRDRPADPAGSILGTARAAAGCRGCFKAVCTATAETCSSGACQATGLSAGKVVRQRRLPLKKKAAPGAIRRGASFH